LSRVNEIARQRTALPFLQANIEMLLLQNLLVTHTHKKKSNSQAALSGRENPRPEGCKAGSASISPDIKSPFLSLELSGMRQQLRSKRNRASGKTPGLDLRPLR